MRNISTKSGVMKMHGGTIHHKKKHPVAAAKACPVMQQEVQWSEKPRSKAKDTNLERLRQSLSEISLGGGMKKTYAKF